MRLLVVEDEPDLAEALARGLRRDGHAVDVALNAYDADMKLRTAGYDLVCLDWNPPEGSGLELRRGLATVLIAQHATIDGAVRAMRSGASSVLMMPAPVDMVRQLLREAHRLAAKRRPALVEQFTAQKRLATLTDEELAVLEHLLVGMVNKEIARRESIGLRTAELRRARILKKMGAGSLAELVRMVCAARGVVLPWHE